MTKTTFFRHSSRAVAATLLLSAVTLSAPAMAAPIFAGVSADTVRTTIDIRDLATDHGIERTYKKLERKAKSACEMRRAQSIAKRQMAKVCAAKLLSDFIEDVDNDDLRSYAAAVQTKDRAG